YEKIIFVVLAAVAAWYAYVGFARLVKVVQRGQVGELPRTDGLVTRLVTGTIKTMSQRTVFRDRPVASFFHSFIFYGFVLYLAVNVVDGLNGFLPPSFTARFDLGWFGDVYHLFTDVLTVLILVGMVFFLARRFLVKPRILKHNERTLLHEDVAAGSVRRDSLVVGVFILLHVGFRLMGESFLLAAR